MKNVILSVAIFGYIFTQPSLAVENDNFPNIENKYILTGKTLTEEYNEEKLAKYNSGDIDKELAKYNSNSKDIEEDSIFFYYSTYVYFRSTGANPNATNKHSSVSITLPNQDLQDGAYELIVNHRSPDSNTQVRIYNPKIKTYTVLGILPTFQDFCDTTFNLSSWANTIRDEPLATSVISTYLSFVGGKSDIQSFRIHSRGKTLKEVVLGDQQSESQTGIHVYGPETDRDANEWSIIQEESVPA